MYTIECAVYRRRCLTEDVLSTVDSNICLISNVLSTVDCRGGLQYNVLSTVDSIIFAVYELSTVASNYKLSNCSYTQKQF